MSASADSQLPRPRDLLAAIAALTVVPVPAAAQLGPSALFYPLVGLAVGGGWWLLDRALGPLLSPLPRAAVVVAALTAFNGGRHLRGLARTVTGITAGRDRPQALRRMASGRIGFPGAIAALGVVALQLRSLCYLDQSRLPALVFAPMLASWSIVVLAHGSRAARDDGRRMKYASEVSFREFALTSVLTFGVLFSLSQATGIVVGVSAAVLVVVLRVLYHWWLDGLTDTTVAAAAEVSLTFALVLFAAMDHGPG